MLRTTTIPATRVGGLPTAEAASRFEAALDAFEGTVIAVSDDRAFLRSFAGRVGEVRAGHVHPFPGGYDGYLEPSGRG